MTDEVTNCSECSRELTDYEIEQECTECESCYLEIQFEMKCEAKRLEREDSDFRDYPD